ncbi:hypothetical protein [Paenibacillus polymyxa]|uniref:hypothetical protein n=1 Tax=Paenibacillus polymyxa TaxID=1406 RepID=UPI00058A3302|nr:hypothetical protein [Paenibacillus polymyxa]AJE53057.1 hypothetical protein RE92_19470 [Paenibacillus polymyxa]QOH63101.1 hypothetical protein DI243_17510 [Paenibacillus polymyxa]
MKETVTPEYKLGLFYVSGPIEESDLLLISSDLNENGIQFIALDKSGQINASIDEFSNVFSFLVSSPLAMGLVSGILASATWDSIKTVILRTFKKVKNKKCNKITKNGVEEKQITFGIEVKINDDHYNFKFNGISSDEAMREALDNIMSLLQSKQSLSSEINHLSGSGLPNYIATYDEVSKIWIVRDTNKIILDKIENSK